MMQKDPKIILGVDPGTLFLGYGLLEVREGQLGLLHMGVLKLSPRKDAYERLRLIQQKVGQLISEFCPQDFAIEAPFFGKNVQSMLKLGRAQGVAIATAMQFGIPVTEYSPRKVKKSITGNGNAGKEQVWKMLQHLLHMDAQNPSYDASDALAVAICHHFQFSSAVTASSKKSGGWGGFIRDNPSRIRWK